MKKFKNKSCSVYFLALFILLALIGLSASDVFAMEESGKGRIIWNNIMLWVNFGILVFIFIKYARKPLMNFLYGESQKIKENIDSVEAQITKAKELMDAESEKLKNIDEYLSKTREMIIGMGLREKEEIIEKAKMNAEQMIKDAEKESEYRLVAARKTFGQEMLNAAISIVTNKLKEGLSLEEDDVIIERFTSGLGNLKESVNNDYY